MRLEQRKLEIKNMEEISDDDERTFTQYRGREELWNFVRKRVSRGSRPLKELEVFLRKMIEEAMEHDQLMVITNPETDLTFDEYRKMRHFSKQKKEYNKIDAGKWKTKKEKCKGFQLLSPIDILTEKVKKCKYYERLNFSGLLDPEIYTTITNNGSVVEGTLQGDAIVSGGPLFGKYKLDNFRFHFGDKNDNGTEHAINGERYALEMQLVFSPIWCEELPLKVVRTQSAYVVLAILFRESTQLSNYELFSLIPHLKEKGASLCVFNNLMYDFRKVLDSSEYYNYIGSSTEVVKNPNVEWIIFKEIQPIQKSQMDLLRSLKARGYIDTNVTTTLPIGERTVYEPSYRNCMRWDKEFQ